MQARRSSGKTTLGVIAAVVIALQAVAADAAITSVTTSSEVLVGAETFGFSTNASDVVVSTAANTFMVRFGFNHNSAGGSLVEQTLQGLGKYAAGFTVGSSGNYDLTVSVRRVGELRRAQTLLGDINCGADVAPLRAPSLTLNAVETGPALEQLALPGVSIPRGSGTTAIELPEGTVSQTIRLEARPNLDDVSLVFEMGASLTEDDVFGCELVARLGAQNATTVLCDNCVYPGVFAPRDINQDGLFLTVTIEDLCGNGGPNPGEECDLGERNGPGSCCTITCQLRQQDEICRLPAGDCDQPDACTGASPECSADAKRPASQVCRAAAADGCDVAENCSGSDNTCPVDIRKGDGVLCRPANPDALGCDFAEVCDGGVCQPDAKAAANTPCQSDANVCTDERCNASGQCAHIPVAPPGKICDDALFCNGEDRCDAGGVCGLHLNAPCGGTQTCDEVGNACLAQPPILVTNADDSGPGSLRFAMGTAFDQAGADSISFDPEFFSAPRRIRLTGPLPDINGDLSILGPGANLLTIDGANLDRVFKVASGVTADLRGLTITGGNAGGGAGGGILNGGALTITRCHITGNTAAFGGGISTELGSSLIVDKSTISNNTATGNSTGGGIASTSDVTITNSTISGNRATGSGGDNGGGLRLGAATIENSTITNNFAVGPNRAGGLRVNVGTVTLRNSIIAANTASTPDVSSSSGSLSSGGSNLIGNPGPLNVNGTNDQKGTPAEPLDPLLFPLADNGGGTPSHALRVASPALDKGSRFGAIADQRGATRPFDVASIAGPSDQSDIGAVEMQAAIVINADDTGAGSLRQVIAEAPANGDILFDPAFFSVPRTIALEREIGIAQNLTMHGPGANLLTLSGGNLNGVFRVPAGGLHVAINGATLSGGDAVNAGGAIISGSSLALSRCAIVGSHAGSFGGAVHVSGSVAAFTDCTFSGNSSGVRGGAVELFNASASFTNCTISGNTASFGGGGGISLIAGIGDQTLAITNSTIANNIGTAAGGIRLEAGAGGRVSLTLRNSIIANNTGPSVSESPGVGGTTTVTSLGFNLTSDDGGGYLTDDTDQTNTDPRLGPLQYNGGPTQTHMPLLASPAIDQGNSAGVTTDQRGRTRSFDAADIPAIPGSDNSDIGAVEAHPVIVMNNNNDGDGSLRQVIANAPEGADVLFDPQFFAQSRNILLDGDILVGTSLSIHGPEALLNVSGRSLGRVFNIASDAPVTISDLAILNGKSQFNGGAIASNSDLALTRCTVGNSETDAQGGGVFLHGAVGTFTDSLIGRNVAGARGGGVGLDAASATLTNCTVFGNTAALFGGGISLVTSSGNQTLVVTNTTITENEGSDGAGIRVEALAAPLSAAATLRNSILAGNFGPNLRTLAATNATATITSLGYNLSDDDSAGLLDEPTDQIETNPLLGPLQDNGGPTLTHALLPGSPAIDQGASSGSSTDQRGFPRPLDDPAIDNAQDGDGADIGAFELSLPEPTPTQTVTRTRTPTATTGIGNPTPTRTPTATTGIGNPTPTRTPTRTTGIGSPTPTATPTVGASVCTGDCNRDGTVSVDELIVGVGIALGRQPVGDCLALDRNADDAVDIAELIAGVDNALNDCPVSQP